MHGHPHKVWFQQRLIGVDPSTNGKYARFTSKYGHQKMEKTILFSHAILRYPRFEQTEQFCLAHGFYASDCRGNPCVGTTKKINIP